MHWHVPAGSWLWAARLAAFRCPGLASLLVDDTACRTPGCHVRGVIKKRILWAQKQGQGAQEAVQPPSPLRMHMVWPMCQHVWFLIFVTSCGASFLDLLDSASCSASLGCCLASNKEAHQEAPSAAQTRSRRVSRQCTAAVCAQRVLDWVACCRGVQSCCATCRPVALGGRGSARPGVLPGLHRPTSPCCGARRGPYVLWVVRPSAHPPAHPPLPCFPFSPPCRLPARSAVAVGPAGGGAGHFLPLRLRLQLPLPRGGAPTGGLRARAQGDGA